MESSGFIYLLCGCETEHDACGSRILLGRRLTGILTANGERQARNLAVYLQARGVTDLYTGPSRPLVRMTGILSQRLGCRTTYCVSLHDVDVGCFEGRDPEQHHSCGDRDAGLYKTDPLVFGCPGGETLKQVQQRTVKFLNALATRCNGQRIAVVVHKYVAIAILSKLMDIESARVREIDQTPGCVNVIRTVAGRSTVQRINCTENSFMLDVEDDPCVVSLNMRAASAL